MARPIEATPILKGKDAQRVYEEATRKTAVSPEKKKEMNDCVKLYERFISSNKNFSVQK